MAISLPFTLASLLLSIIASCCLLPAAQAGDLAKYQRETVTRSPFATKYTLHKNILRLGGTISYDANDDYRFYGQQMLDAWIFFIEWVNQERGGLQVNGTNYSVALAYMDDFTQSEYVYSGIDFLLGNRSILEGLDFLLSPYSSALTNTAQQMAIYKDKILASSGASTPNSTANGANTFYTLLQDSDAVLSYFNTFANAGAKSIAVIKEEDLDRCSLNDIMRASVLTNITVESYDIVNSSHTLGVQDFADYLNGLTADTILVCSRQYLCEGIKIALQKDSVTYFPKGMAMSPCASNFHPEFTISSVPWSYELNQICQYTHWSAHDFFDNFTERFRVTPTYHAASAFASALILLTAVESTQSFETQVVLDEISRNRYETFYGNCSFGNEFRQCDMKPIVLQKMLETGYSLNKSLSHESLDKESIIYPTDKATSSFIYPALTIAQRECDITCQQGTCNSLGDCECQGSYYGSSCSVLCNGEVVAGECFDVRTVYVGGMLVDSSVPEYMAMMRLAVVIINNKTDGFFDFTERIKFEFLMNYTGCASDQAMLALADQEAWAKAKGGELGGLIGPMCSEVCVSVADYAKTLDLPEIGFYSASSDLSDPDRFAFFSRTYPSSENQALLLTNMLEELGLVQHIFVLYYDDYLGNVYNQDFTAEWTSRDYILLGSHAVPIRTHTTEPYSSVATEEIEAMLKAILQSGSPIVLFCVPYEIAESVVIAAAAVEAVDSSSIMWVFSDFFVTYDLDKTNIEDYVGNVASHTLNGAFFLHPFQAANDIADTFIDMWQDLDPVEYPDYNGDRTDIMYFSSYIIDSFCSLALAYEKTLEEGNYEDGSLFRERVYFNLVNNVEFEGLSGMKSFNSFGDLSHPVFSVLYVGLEGEFVEVGNINDTSVNINVSSFYWPDGSQGKTSLYSNQLRPLCAEGYQPTTYTYPDTSYELLTCSLCPVGTYKPTYGSDSCTDCVEGMDCNDVGLSIPCLLPGYWRPPDEALNEAGPYSVYVCDVFENCVGGCVFNESCKYGVSQSSPTCGVCADGYAATTSNECIDCTEKSEYLWIIFAFSCIFVTCVVFVFLWKGVKEEAKPVFTTGISSTDKLCQKTQHLKKDNCEDNYATNSRILSLKPIRYISKINDQVSGVTKKIDLQAVTTNSITSFKLILSFYQIMTQVVFELDVEWPEKLNILFNSSIIHRPQYLSLSFCTSNDAQVYYDIMFFYILMPIFSFLLLWALGAITYVFGIQRRAQQQNKSNMWIQANVARLRTNILRIMLLFCLTIFPIVTSEYLLFFDCRDFGVYGTYLRQDYSVECDTNKYSAHMFLAIFGILLFGVGIPVFFYYVVKHRDQEVFANSSVVLHRSFKDNYKQFEIVALFHKVLLFSVVSFVATPGTSSQCLFLLLCNVGYFAVLALCQPYDFYTDTILALSLTSIECFAFLVALLVISGVAEKEEYSMDEIYNVLYSLLIIAVCLLAPSLYAMKYDRVNTIILKKTGVAVNRVKKMARRSTRRSSALLSAISGRGGDSSELHNNDTEEERGNCVHVEMTNSRGGELARNRGSGDS